MTEDRPALGRSDFISEPGCAKSQVSLPRTDRRSGEAAAIATRQPCRMCLSGCNTQELLKVLAGDEPPSADLHVGQVPAPHLVIQQVPGQAGQAGRLGDGVGQPFGGQVWFFLAGLSHGQSGFLVMSGRRSSELCMSPAQSCMTSCGAFGAVGGFQLRITPSRYLEKPCDCNDRPAASIVR